MSGSNDHIDDIDRRYGELTIAEAAERLRGGELVAVPTETVYGLAADSTNTEAVAEIYRTKGRPDFNPLIVHVPDQISAKKLGHFNALACKIADRFWPGPLTLVVPLNPTAPVTAAVTAGLDTIALRCPAHPVMQKLLKTSGLFLAAPSANKSGAISPTTAKHVRHSLGDCDISILDAGASADGLESTIVAVTGENYHVLRPGPVSTEGLAKYLGQAPSQNSDPKIQAPGQLASHYAPSKILRLDSKQAEHGEFLIGFGSVGGHISLSESGDLAEAASKLFALLHIADASEMSAIAIAPIPAHGIGRAINDRLRRAAFRE
ncbi:L-threonylcarbamoyladenylate synthase [Parasphingorhabdus sp.]|uniref:L-threonylcarbamoyladenylate synthase n=1 Tax=Parasphingorhabdus sp. TaxID=2709688 RepID=UPI003266BCBB